MDPANDFLPVLWPVSRVRSKAGTHLGLNGRTDRAETARVWQRPGRGNGEDRERIGWYLQHQPVLTSQSVGEAGQKA